MWTPMDVWTGRGMQNDCTARSQVCSIAEMQVTQSTEQVMAANMANEEIHFEVPNARENKSIESFVYASSHIHLLNAPPHACTIVWSTIFSLSLHFRMSIFLSEIVCPFSSIRINQRVPMRKLRKLKNTPGNIFVIFIVACVQVCASYSYRVCYCA